MANLLYTDRIQGNGPPLLMLHGWGMSLEDIKPLGHLLSPQADIHLVDLPGFGHSPYPGEVWNSFQYANRLVAYLNENNIDQIDLLGHSFGGKVALSLANLYPTRVRKLILIATSGLIRQRNVQQYCRFMAIKLLGKNLKYFDSLFGTKLFFDYFAPRFGSADYKKAGAMRQILVKSVNEDLSKQIATIKTPTLILWGEKDEETPPEVAHRLHKLIKNSTLLLLPGKGHWLYRDVGAHLCAHYIAPFLRGQENL